MAASSERSQKLQTVLDNFDISVADANDLAHLRHYDIVVIADDSSSMTFPADPAGAESPATKQVKTRWEELRETIAAVVEIGACLSRSVDVHFLNRKPLLGATSASSWAFRWALSGSPYGSTPLTETLEQVAEQLPTGGRKVLLLVLTDGLPDGGPGPFKDALRRLVATGRVLVQILACTPDVHDVAWLDGLGQRLGKVDVTEDFTSERRQVLQAGLATHFSRGDWCTKALLGLVSQKFDTWNERKNQGVALGHCLSSKGSSLEGCFQPMCSIM